MVGFSLAAAVERKKPPSLRDLAMLALYAVSNRSRWLRVNADGLWFCTNLGQHCLPISSAARPTFRSPAVACRG